MPHTRAARLRAMQEASDLRDVLQLHESSINPGWNEYLDWDLPGLTYQPDALAWFPNEGATPTDQHYFANAHPTTTSAPEAPLDNNYERASNADFCGLQPWYSNTTGELSPVSPVATAHPQPSTSALTSHDSSPLGAGGEHADQTHGNPQWSPRKSRRQASFDEETYARMASHTRSADVVRKPEESQSPSSEEEKERINIAKSDAHKKRKIAHSVIEKNYRCRIKDGMAELRHCVPSREKGRRSLDSGGQPVTGDAGSNQSSGKVAILSDAVQYVKALERQNEALHGQLDTMQRRNNTLQKIALSKVDTTVAAEEIDDEDGDGEEPMGRGRGEQAGQKSKKSGVRGRDEGRLKAVAHAPNPGRRYEGVTGTLAGIKIPGE